jgi:hypothetical protein
MRRGHSSTALSSRKINVSGRHFTQVFEPKKAAFCPGISLLRRKRKSDMEGGRKHHDD